MKMSVNWFPQNSKGDKFCRKEEKALRNSVLFTSGNHELLFSS